MLTQIFPVKFCVKSFKLDTTCKALPHLILKASARRSSIAAPTSPPARSSPSSARDLQRSTNVLLTRLSILENKENYHLKEKLRKRSDKGKRGEEVHLMFAGLASSPPHNFFRFWNITNFHRYILIAPTKENELQPDLWKPRPVRRFIAQADRAFASSSSSPSSTCNNNISYLYIINIAKYNDISFTKNQIH